MPGYLEFEVTLRGITPRLWRRFQIVDDATFGDLHRAIRDSFGWYGGHLWEFRDSRQRAFAGFAYDFTEDFDEPTPDAEEVKLASYFAKAWSCTYIYDFGDDWSHAVKLRERVSSPTVSTGVCSRGDGHVRRKTAAACLATTGSCSSPRPAWTPGRRMWRIWRNGSAGGIHPSST